eukprot:22142-Prymnesium_polylepis.1
MTSKHDVRHRRPCAHVSAVRAGARAGDEGHVAVAPGAGYGVPCAAARRVHRPARRGSRVDHPRREAAPPTPQPQTPRLQTSPPQLSSPQHSPPPNSNRL